MAARAGRVGVNKAAFVYMGDVAHVAVSQASECLKAAGADVIGEQRATGARSVVVRAVMWLVQLSLMAAGSCGIKACRFKTLVTFIDENVMAGETVPTSQLGERTSRGACQEVINHDLLNGKREAFIP